MVDVTAPDFLQSQAQSIRERYEFLTSSTDELYRLREAYKALTGQELSAISQDTDLSELRTQLENAHSQRDAYKRDRDEFRELNTRTAGELARHKASTDVIERELKESRRRTESAISTGKVLEARVEELEKLLDEATGPDVPPPKPAAAPAKSPAKEPPSVGGFDQQPPFAADVERMIARHFTVGREFAMGDLAKHFPGVNPPRLRERLKELVESGSVRWNGKTARGSKYSLARAPQRVEEKKEEEPPGAPAQGEPAPAVGAGALVREHVASLPYGDGFSPRSVAEALQLPYRDVLPNLELLVSRGHLSDDSPSADMRLFSRVKPPHVVKTEQRSEGRPDVRGQAKRGAPQPGTGRSLTITDPDVRALVQDAVRAGASAEKAPNGHIDIIWPRHRIQIAGTPGSRRTVMNDRTRLRREGLEV